jgi:hypothetical protein
MTQQTDRIMRELTEHTEEEMARYNQMLKAVHDANEASEKRHSSLIQSIHAYMTKQNEIENAFLKNEQGAPDFHGHWYDHSHRKQAAIWWGNVKGGTIAKLVEWGAIAVIAWIGMNLWTAFLHGPHQ